MENEMTGPCPYCGGAGGHHYWAGSGGCPGAKPRTEKDAEIERLNEAITVADELVRAFDNESTKLKLLITELADALARIPIVLTPPDRDLVRRAREATG